MYWSLQYSYKYSDDIYSATFKYEDLQNLYDYIAESGNEDIEIYGINLLENGNVIKQLKI